LVYRAISVGKEMTNILTKPAKIFRGFMVGGGGYECGNLACILTFTGPRDQSFFVTAISPYPGQIRSHDPNAPKQIIYSIMIV
jgi:hypothetical protein